MEKINKFYQGDALDILKQMPDNFINCCVTSPPYFNLRDYDNDQQIGLENTPEEYDEKLMLIFREIKRILKSNGTLWLNIADSYGGSYKEKGDNSTLLQTTNQGSKNKINLKTFKSEFIKSKDLIGIPWMVAFALRADGWYLRQDIIWNKPNPMPESVKDRCTKSHEYIFLLSKSNKYYYDFEAIKTPLKKESEVRLAQDIKNQEGSFVPGKTNGKMKAVCGGKKMLEKNKTESDPMFRKNTNREYTPNQDLKANKKSVWTNATENSGVKHFATFPQKLINDCIKAGCPENGLVLDPFMGTGTTAIVARKQYKNFIGIELNEEYIKFAENRLLKELGLFV